MRSAPLALTINNLESVLQMKLINVSSSCIKTWAGDYIYDLNTKSL